MTERRTLGIDRPVRLDWLDAAAAQLAAGRSEREAREHVWRLLEGELSGDTPYTARGKTMTVISRIWIAIAPERKPLRDRALALMADATPEGRIAIHWAMTLAAYPFFRDLAESVGKLLRLHGSFAKTQLERRLTEKWGDRSTLRTAVQRLIRMLVGFDVISEGETRGTYIAPGHLIEVKNGLVSLLAESLILGTNSRLSVDELRVHPALFPFRVGVAVDVLRKDRRFDVHREEQGDVITMRF